MTACHCHICTFPSPGPGGIGLQTSVIKVDDMSRTDGIFYIFRGSIHTALPRVLSPFDTVQHYIQLHKHKNTLIGSSLCSNTWLHAEP